MPRDASSPYVAFAAPGAATGSLRAPLVAAFLVGSVVTFFVAPALAPLPPSSLGVEAKPAGVLAKAEDMMSAKPWKFAVAGPTPVELQLSRGTCWIFAALDVLEWTYRQQGLKNGWLEPNEYVRMSEQAFGIAVLDACLTLPTNSSCAIGDTEVWRGRQLMPVNTQVEEEGGPSTLHMETRRHMHMHMCMHRVHAHAHGSMHARRVERPPSSSTSPLSSRRPRCRGQSAPTHPIWAPTTSVPGLQRRELRTHSPSRCHRSSGSTSEHRSRPRSSALVASCPSRRAWSRYNTCCPARHARQVPSDVILKTSPSANHALLSQPSPRSAAASFRSESPTRCKANSIGSLLAPTPLRSWKGVTRWAWWASRTCIARSMGSREGGS